MQTSATFSATSSGLRSAFSPGNNRLNIPVSTLPGHNATILTLLTSSAADSVRPITANFDAQYAPSSGIPSFPAPEEMFIIKPVLFSISGIIFFIYRKVPLTFTSITSSNSSTPVSHIYFFNPFPALFTSISTSPNSLIVLWITSFTSFSIVTSPFIYIDLPPASFISVLTFSISLAVLPVTITFAPSLASLFAIYSPIPLPLPVTITLLFSSFIKIPYHKTPFHYILKSLIQLFHDMYKYLYPG